MKRTVALLACAMFGMTVWGQTPAAPAPPPTLRNTTRVPAAPVKAGDDRTEVGETPIDTPADQPATDVTPAGSPVPRSAHTGYFSPGTVLHVRLTQAIDSAHQKNGDAVAGVLVSSVTAANGKVMAKGTPLKATVISAATAGIMASYGVLTLELVRVGGIGVYTNVLDFDGQEGHKDLPDSAPAKGTEAAVSRGTVLTFKVLGAGNQPDSTVHDGLKSGGASIQPGASSVGGASTPGFTTPAPGVTKPH